jgi:hypothetical protein
MVVRNPYSRMISEFYYLNPSEVTESCTKEVFNGTIPDPYPVPMRRVPIVYLNCPPDVSRRNEYDSPLEYGSLLTLARARATLLGEDGMMVEVFPYTITGLRSMATQYVATRIIPDIVHCGTLMSPHLVVFRVH